jgi:phosphocarrier protein HPr
MEFAIKLTTIADVYELVSIVTKHNGEVDLSQGRYLVNAESIMGIFSLNLTEPVTVIVRGNDAESIRASLDKFIV